VKECVCVFVCACVKMAAKPKLYENCMLARATQFSNKLVRERNEKRNIYTHTHVNACTYVYIYIYI